MAKLELPHVTDEITNRSMRLLLDRVNTIDDAAIISGSILTGVVLTTSEKNVPHNLGRKPQGFIVIGISADTTVFGRSHDSNHLNLTAGASCTADIWVF